MSDVRINRMRAAHRRESGLGLIEVLVAVLVLSVGILGVAALQATSLATSSHAMARGMATIASYSMLDAMRADVVAARRGDYDTIEPLQANACPDAGADLRQAQQHDWCTWLGSVLGVSGQVTGDIHCVGHDGNCTVTIIFDDGRRGFDDERETVVTKALL